MRDACIRRQTKAENSERNSKLLEEKRDLQTLKNIKGALDTKRYKIENIPLLLKQQEELTEYLKSKGAMDSEGKIQF